LTASRIARAKDQDSHFAATCEALECGSVLPLLRVELARAVGVALTPQAPGQYGEKEMPT
jgi:hypothetical protein